MITYIFYHNLVAGSLTLIVFLHFFFKWIRKQKREKQVRHIRREFQEVVEILSNEFLTGHSAENAMHEAKRQLSVMEGESAYMVKALKGMTVKISLGESAENVWSEFALSCELEEVKEFAKAFSLAKRSGASMPFIMKKISEQMTQKVEIQEQIETMIAGKRFEQKIMNMMPIGILLYMSWTSPQLLDVMYSTARGRIIMTICLSIYIAAYIWSENITRLN